MIGLRFLLLFLLDSLPAVYCGGFDDLVEGLLRFLDSKFYK
jgi:hypothetical protein